MNNSSALASVQKIQTQLNYNSYRPSFKILLVMANGLKETYKEFDNYEAYSSALSALRLSIK